jgi:hypothetical protein
MDRHRKGAVWVRGCIVIHKTSIAAGMATCALAAVGLAGCGGSPSGAQLRETVHRYLDATTPAERCQLLTTVYRTENPDVLFSGGCRQSEEISAADEAARKRLRIAKVDIHGNQATVTFGSSSGGSPTGHLTGLAMQSEGGQWRINGFTATASATASAG